MAQALVAGGEVAALVPSDELLDAVAIGHL